MKITGKDIIDAITKRLEEDDILCYDSAIVNELRELNWGETLELFTLGDVASWHNERIADDTF